MLTISVNLYAQSGTVMIEDEKLNGQIKKLTETWCNYKNEPHFYRVYTFDNFGLLLSKKESGQSIEQGMRYIYDSEKKLIKSYSLCGGLSEEECPYTDFFYDNRGNEIKHILNYPKSTEKSIWYFDYDATYYTYNDENKLIEKKQVNKSRKLKKEYISSHYKYQYDSLDNCVLEEELSRRGEVIKKTNKKYLNHNLIEAFT
jgi:hypothetical protein